LEPLDRREVNRIVARHDGNHGVGSGQNGWTCQRHLTTLIFAQIAGLGSLREIEQGLAAQPRQLYHLDLRLPRRSTLSDAQAQRPAAVFRDICQSLMGRASRAIRKEGAALIQLIDASPIALRDQRFGWAEADARTRGLKLHIGYDPRADVPDWIEVTSPKISDVTAARERMAITPGATYVFDKGYVDYGWWHHIHSQQAIFVTRLKNNAKRRDVQPRPARGNGILQDNDIHIGHARPRGGAVNALYGVALREILVERDGKAPMRLITNDLESPATDIAALYKERWQIELLFKWIKQNLRIKRFLGRSENAVKIQIYAALIAFMLLRMLRHNSQNGQNRSAKALIARIKVALFAPLDLTDRCTSPPRQPASLPPSPQLALNFPGL
jgi:IS4 transposase